MNELCKQNNLADNNCEVNTLHIQNQKICQEKSTKAIILVCSLPKSLFRDELIAKLDDVTRNINIYSSNEDFSIAINKIDSIVEESQKERVNQLINSIESDIGKLNIKNKNVIFYNKNNKHIKQLNKYKNKLKHLTIGKKLSVDQIAQQISQISEKITKIQSMIYENKC